MISAGWPEKKITDLIEEVRNLDVDAIRKRSKALKRTLAKHQAPDAKKAESTAAATDRALKMLRSAGPYSESELLNLLTRETKSDLLDFGKHSKGSLRGWLLNYSTEHSADEMIKVVGHVRNQLVHNPPPGWSIRDVR
jgi:hypothetical protein